ncbi:MAG: hypothetical protein KUG77_12275 [Nannocystaceae bacterium]|nr:hypothetical protein [Nannocystaceae bacterium]
MKCFAWISAVCLALPLAAGCPSDEEDSAGNDGGNSGSNTSPETTTDDEPTTTAEGSSGGGGEGLQSTWGAPCTQDSECEALLGTGGVCLNEAVIFELPGGYCSKLCTLPEGSKYSVNDPQCDPAGGIDCIGQAPLFEVCAPPCTEDSQCGRSQYACRNFPLIAEEGDPTYCLMPDCCQESCDAC